MQTSDPGSASLKLLVLGFNENERRLLQSIVKLSQRRTPTLHLLETAEGSSADVVLVDAQDKHALQWAKAQPWLGMKPVGWVDTTEDVAPNHTDIKRPVQWPILPMLLSRIMFKAGENAPPAGATQAPAEPAQPAAVPHPQTEPATSTPSSQQEAAIIGEQTAKPEPRKVLVVDDSLAVRQQLQSFLEKRGVNAEFAESGDEAISRCQNTYYDCVMLDVLMPGMDGYETCRRLKALPHMMKKVKIIMLTSRTSPFDRIRGKMAGCDTYLTKPVQAQKLYETLNQYLHA